MDTSKITSDFQKILEESNLPEDGKNLRSKIDSIMRTIENLSAKKLRLEIEIKQQKRVLTRKREELRRRSKSNQIRLKAALESTGVTEVPDRVQKTQRLDQDLLRRSAQLLEE